MTDCTYNVSVHLGFLKVLSARRHLSVFLLGLLCLACGLAGWQIWLTLRLMEQGRRSEEQGLRERAERMANLAMAETARSLGDWDLALREINSLPPSAAVAARLPADAILILVSRGATKAYPPTPVLFVPNPPVPSFPRSHAFDAADTLESREQQYERALTVLQPLVANPATRPEALIRIARIESKLSRPQAALDTYVRLAGETGGNSSGVPYALQAESARCRVLIDLGQKQDAAAAALTLRASLLQGRWPLRRDVFEYYWNELEGFGIAAGQPPQSSVDLASLVTVLYERWNRSRSASGGDLRGNLSLLAWDSTSERLIALVTTPGWLTSALKLPPIQPPGPREPPIMVSVPPPPGAVVTRGRIWVSGVALMVVLVLIAGYAVHRGISQELRVARLQSDFVAAVSHEFRSPLTTLRSITELLAQDRITDESRRRQSYLFLDRETNRLHRLVEDLLDFGRMESGRKQYRMAIHNAFQLARVVVADFTESSAANGFRVETSFAADQAMISTDEEALCRAIRNLLENAVKYSPECRTVWVEGAVADHHVSISVRDRGIGIDPREQRAIFRKFVRGDAAKRAGIKGTGIGLSMVQQISEALGGEVRLRSKPGFGSTFTIILPLARE